ncbi:MAG: tRNA uridine-5-carboxymethylaminomethyl(34) synthesis GTPase MnmE [Candidatus Hydrogenedentes bacterium]|nr:tRNA uridine-5-carboxymethylaminomethyl(34) synthesis GTPase MnmE [Candidatus Hydrogenedentota bacterium]
MPRPVSRRSPDDTIAAISTPPGEGGIGIVRLSGPDAVPITHRLFASSRGKDIRSAQGRVFHGSVCNETFTIDEVLVHVMRAPRSYTAEDVVEINCHGGAGPLQTVLELVLQHGARLAEPGEFTKRAFLNGRIDLVQAEAVIDRIQARTSASLRAASAAAGGVLSKSIYEARDTLVDALARIESAIDFPDDDLPELVDEALRARLTAVLSRLHELIATAEAGRLYREGARLAIAGRPNVGKSSLFNALLRDARAIVTAVPGTTRDRLEETLTISGVPVRISDTAGLRDTGDEVERIGIERARDAVKDADVVLLVLDATAIDESEVASLATEILAFGRPTIAALNKIDLVSTAEPPSWLVRRLNAAGMIERSGLHAICPVSAKTGEGLQELEDAMTRVLLGDTPIAPDQGLITRVHQRDSARRAALALERLLANYNASPEFLSIDLRDSLDALGEITGDTTSEDLLARIFSSFCIGK